MTVRVRILERLHDLLQRDTDELAWLISHENGKVYANTGYRAGGAKVYLEHMESLRQRRIKCFTIDDDRLGRRRGVVEGMSGGRHEAHCRERIEDGVGRQIHRRDCVLGEHAGAMHWGANSIMLLVDGNGPTAISKVSRGRQTPGPATDDRYIKHVGHDYIGRVRDDAAKPWVRDVPIGRAS